MLFVINQSINQSVYLHSNQNVVTQWSAYILWLCPKRYVFDLCLYSFSDKSLCMITFLYYLCITLFI